MHCRKNRISKIIVFFIYLLTAKVILPQIPINGFCKYENFDIDPNYKNMISLNFNKDSYNDLVLYGNRNEISAYQGNPNSKFAKTKLTKLKIEISCIKPINQNMVSNLFAFTSRKNRMIGLLGFSTTGVPKILTENKLNSFPDNLSIADINRNGSEEILLCGGSYEGLSIFYIKENKLIEKKIVPKGIFSQAVFADLNNDEYPDIAAADLINHSMVFFYNYGSGIFKEIRRFYLPDKITDLQTTDFDLDGFKDLVVSAGNQINIFFGDGYSSYNKIINIPTQLSAEKLITRDFNGDGYIDVAYLNKTFATVSIFYSKENYNFYPEITYLKKNNLTDIIPFYSRFINGLLTYCKDGKLFLIERLRILSDNTQIILGSSPYNINYFDEGNDKVIDLSYYDKDSKSLNLLLRNNYGIPTKLFSIKLQAQFRNLTVDDNDPDKKTFYCYSFGERLIEIITIDFKLNTVNKDKLYTYGPICDLKIERSGEEEKAKIYVLSNRDGELNLSIINFKDFRYTSANSPRLAFNVFSAKLILENPLGIFYWEKENNSATFNKMIINRDLKPENYSFKYSLPGDKPDSIVLITGDITNSDRNDAVSFIRNKNGKSVILTSGDKQYKLYLNSQIVNPDMSGESHIRLGEIRFNGLNKLTIFNFKDDCITKLDIIYKKRLLLPTRLADTKNLESFFIKNMNFKKYHLVYIDEAENCIIIKEIT